MSNNATRFTSMHNVRTGMMAHMGLMQAVQAEKEEQARHAALMAEIDQLVLDTFPAYVNYATPEGARITRYLQDRNVVVTYKTRRFTVSTTQYAR